MTLKSSKYEINQNYFYLLCQLWGSLSGRRRRQLFASLILMLLNSFAEVVSLAAVLPFLAVLANPTGLWNQPLVQEWGPQVGISNSQELLIPVTLFFAVTALLAGAIRMLNLWIINRVTAAIGSEISCEAFRRSLFQPYITHVSSNSSSFIASIGADVGRVIGGVVLPLLMLISSFTTVFSIAAVLLTIDWSIALSTSLVVFLVYAISLAQNRKPLKLIGQSQRVLYKRLIQTMQEGLGAIRDVLLDGSQNFYCEIYQRTDNPMRRNEADARFLSSYPKMVLEPVGIAAIAVFGLLLVNQQGVGRALPLLGALALGAQRLLPVVQKIYENWAVMSTAKASLIKVLNLINQPMPSVDNRSGLEPMRLKQSLRFEGVHFSYGIALPQVLKGLDFEIRRGERIGIVGGTGSGKSTTLDLLIGLLQPTSGRVLVDTEDIFNSAYPQRLERWRSAIAHVPQTIYLADSSIAENIAFGIPRHLIDINLVKSAAQQAQIASFIESTDDGYETFAGERGIRLSGGQRQRIGIARALYKQAQILVFDEATSALDTFTEQSVMQAIEGLSKELTIVMIAHRLSTVRNCDRIIMLKDGYIEKQGSPSQILIES